MWSGFRATSLNERLTPFGGQRLGDSDLGRPYPRLHRTADVADHLVSYLGWHGTGNLGDDAIYDAVRSQLPGAIFLDFPRFPREMICAVATGLDRSLRHGTQVVGGGTLIGRRHWRLLVNLGRRSQGIKEATRLVSGLRTPSSADARAARTETS
jgi:hypothetical protein